VTTIPPLQRAKAPKGCYWRGYTLWGRAKINGRTKRWSLRTNEIAAARRKAGRNLAIAQALDKGRDSGPPTAKIRPRRKLRSAAITESDERISLDDAVPLIGVSTRKLQQLAARGEIPGAAKFGRRWTFNLVKLRAYIAAKEAEVRKQAKPPRLTSYTESNRLEGAIRRSLRRLAHASKNFRY